MTIRQDIVGTHYRYPDYFVVGREKIREFAKAVKNNCAEHLDEEAAKAAGHDTLIAPITFLAVAGRQVQLKIFTEMDLPINLARVLHRDQKLKFHRPIRTGDRLYFDSYLDSILESHGMVTAEVRAEVTDDNGEQVATSIVTMIGEAQGQENPDAVTAAVAAHRKP
jgi:acyl dehydratase